ncbi:MAG: GNAT family N-acetyltransferase [Spirochaetota bacterium]
MSIVVRQARENDRGRITRYFSAFYATDPDTVFRRPGSIPEAEVLNLIKQSTADSGMLFLIALCEQDVVGTLTFSRYGKAEMSHGGEFGMSVHPMYRRQGIGSSLVARMGKWVAALGLKRIDLQVWSNNCEGIALYESAGFHREGLREGAIRRGNEEIDIILMSKTVSQQGALRDV